MEADQTGPAAICPPAAPTWKERRYRLEAAALRGVAGTVSRLPRSQCAAVSRWIGRIAFSFDARGRTVALENLGLVFGDTLSPRERAALARESYGWFVRTMGDLFWSGRLHTENVRDFIRFEGAERIAEERGGAIVAIPHLAGFEWISVGTALGIRPGMGVAEPFKNPLLPAIFDGLRSVGGNIVLPQQGVALRFFRHLKRGGVAGALADLSQPPGNASSIIRSFGMLRSVPALVGALHLRTGCPIVPAEPEPFPDGTMRIAFHEPMRFDPATPLHEVVQAVWDFEEAIIRRRPAHFLWAYKYWRHLPADAGRPYPFYAHPSKRFDRALAAQRGDA